jgi:2-amino-4-hydroxy-6-hydroxymethyldihydropteridine diphosphokinase
MVEAFVGLGSNLGERKKNIENAIRLLTETGEVDLLDRASYYETEPVGPVQPWFINTAIKIETSATPEELLGLCKDVERRIGRVDSFHWGPRLVDLDLLLVKGQVVDEERLKLPHPQMENRRFVLLPMVELEPDMVHPTLKIPLEKLLTDTEEDKKVIKIQ